MLSDLTFALAARGLDVHVVTSRLLYKDQSARLPAREEIKGVQVHRVLTTSSARQSTRLQLLDYTTFLVTGLSKLVSLTYRGDTVVVKTDPPLLSVPVILLSRILGWRQVNWLQDAFPEIARAAGVGSRYKRLSECFFGLLIKMRNASLKHSAATVVLGERMLEHLEGEGLSRDSLTIIPNWSDTRAILPIAADQNELREKWGLANRFVLGYSGNMGVAHDFELLLGAASKLQQDAKTSIVLIGGGKRKARLEREVASRNLTNIAFKPYQPRIDLAASLSVPDVHLVILRPEMEGLIVPSKFYGVAAAGRPTIFIGDLDGEVARMIARFNCGIAVDPSDEVGLVDAVRRYSSDPTLVASHGNNARTMAVEHFDLQISVGKWRALFS